MTLNDLVDYLPKRVNASRWLTWHTLDDLKSIDASTRIVLPVCSLGTPYAELAKQGDLVLPPLYHEALDEPLKMRIISQIERCFPIHELARRDVATVAELHVVELPPSEPSAGAPPEVLAFSVDTAVEEHGPHLPLATDTIQSYAVLQALAAELTPVQLGRPVEYGQLTWGLPFGFSIDLTAELLTEYVRRFVNALVKWHCPRSLYVVDVHGSIVHRRAIIAALGQSDAERWAFRWLHDPLVEFASERGDQHAGGVETALAEHVSPQLLDADWWPDRIDDLADHQMSFATAVELTGDLQRLTDYVHANGCNGIVGDIRNYHQVDAAEMFDRMLAVARSDVETLLSDGPDIGDHDAGRDAW